MRRLGKEALTHLKFPMMTAAFQVSALAGE